MRRPAFLGVGLLGVRELQLHRAGKRAPHLPGGYAGPPTRCQMSPGSCGRTLVASPRPPGGDTVLPPRDPDLVLLPDTPTHTAGAGDGTGPGLRLGQRARSPRSGSRAPPRVALGVGGAGHQVDARAGPAPAGPAPTCSRRCSCSPWMYRCRAGYANLYCAAVRPRPGRRSSWAVLRASRAQPSPGAERAPGGPVGRGRGQTGAGRGGAVSERRPPAGGGRPPGCQ